MAKGKMIDTSTREEDEEVGPSRTKKRAERKARQAAVETVSQQLVALPPRKLSDLGLPEQTQIEIETLRDMANTHAKARQRRLVTQLLRTLDLGDIAARAERLVRAVADDSERHELERWRERLLADDAALGDFLDAHPTADRQRIRQLIRSAKEEQSSGTEKRHYKVLYQFLKEARESDQLLET